MNVIVVISSSSGGGGGGGGGSSSGSSNSSSNPSNDFCVFQFMDTILSSTIATQLVTVNQKHLKRHYSKQTCLCVTSLPQQR